MRFSNACFWAFRGEIGVATAGARNFPSGRTFAKSGKQKRAGKLTFFSPQTY
jgi:hypothetical protein